MPQVIPIEGMRFGRLTVISEAGRSKSRNALWKCLCDCGNYSVVSGAALRGGYIKSCGCISREMVTARNTTHGKRKTRIYRIWHDMKARCLFQKNPNFADYGGRGITVCDEWLNSFEAFYAWAMANGYSDNLTLDRKNNDKGYCPENCRWASRIEQANNKRNNTPIEIDGITMNITQWAKVSGVKQATISYRYKKGLRGADLIKPPDPVCSEKGKKRHSNRTTRIIPKGGEVE